MSIEVQGIEKLLKRVKNMSKEIGDEANTSLKKDGFEIEKNAKINAPRNDGILSASIHSDTVSYLNVEVGSNLVYAPYVEFGTKKKVEIPAGLESYASKFRGKGGGSFDDLLKSVSKWASQKGIPEQFHKIIAINIARDGVKAQPFLFPAYEKQKPKIVQNLKTIVDKKR